MPSNGHIDFRRTVKLSPLDEYSSKADITEVLAFLRSQKVPGELVISLPGNGGISGIVFRGKEVKRPGEIIEDEDSH